MCETQRVMSAGGIKRVRLMEAALLYHAESPKSWACQKGDAQKWDASFSTGAYGCPESHACPPSSYLSPWQRSSY